MDDDRNRERMDQLLANLFVALPELEQLLQRADRCSDHDVGELSAVVGEIIRALEKVAPEGRLTKAGLDTMRPEARARAASKRRTAAGTGEHAVLPFMQGFRQARFFLELAILCGRAGQELPRDLADAGAVLAGLFGIEWRGAETAAASAQRAKRKRTDRQVES